MDEFLAGLIEKSEIADRQYNDAHKIWVDDQNNGGGWTPFPDNALARKTTLHDIIALYKKTTSSTSSTLMSIDEIDNEIDMCAAMFIRGQMWATWAVDKDENSAARAFKKAYNQYHDPKNNGE